MRITESEQRSSRRMPEKITLRIVIYSRLVKTDRDKSRLTLAVCTDIHLHVASSSFWKEKFIVIGLQPEVDDLRRSPAARKKRNSVVRPCFRENHGNKVTLHPPRRPAKARAVIPHTRIQPFNRSAQQCGYRYRARATACSRSSIYRHLYRVAASSSSSSVVGPQRESASLAPCKLSLRFPSCGGGGAWFNTHAMCGAGAQLAARALRSPLSIDVTTVVLPAQRVREPAQSGGPHGGYSAFLAPLPLSRSLSLLARALTPSGFFLYSPSARR